MKQPRFWKILKRHPLSAKYADITGAAWEAYVTAVRDTPQ